MKKGLWFVEDNFVFWCLCERDPPLSQTVQACGFTFDESLARVLPGDLDGLDQKEAHARPEEV